MPHATYRPCGCPPAGTCTLLTHLSVCSNSIAFCPLVGRYIKALEPFYDGFDPGFIAARKAAREILQKEDDLNEIVQLVGKVSEKEWTKGKRKESSRGVRGKEANLCKLLQLVGKVKGSCVLQQAKAASATTWLDALAERKTITLETNAAVSFSVP